MIDRPIPLMFPAELDASLPRSALEDRTQAPAFERSDFHALTGLRIARAGEIHACRHYVDDVTLLVCDDAALTDDRGPGRDQSTTFAGVLFPPYANSGAKTS